MTSLKTTICGSVALIGTIVIQFYPEYTRHGNALVALATGLGLLFARDNTVTSEQVKAAKDEKAAVKEFKQELKEQAVTKELLEEKAREDGVPPT